MESINIYCLKKRKKGPRPVWPGSKETGGEERETGGGGKPLNLQERRMFSLIRDAMSSSTDKRIELGGRRVFRWGLSTGA